MKAYWVTFTDGTEACCEGQSPYDAKQIAEHFTGKTVVGGKYDNIKAEPLPYPASPRIWAFEHPLSGKTPTFCYTPKECAGNSSCRKNRACTD